MAKPTPKLNTEVKPKVELTPEQLVEAQALAEQSAAAAEQAQTAEAERAEKKAQLNTKINVNPTGVRAGESAELIAAVKADADKRGKDFSVCPISGVLVVG